jgi:hypothetical protein
MCRVIAEWSVAARIATCRCGSCSLIVIDFLSATAQVCNPMPHELSDYRDFDCSDRHEDHEASDTIVVVIVTLVVMVLVEEYASHDGTSDYDEAEEKEEKRHHSYTFERTRSSVDPEARMEL